MDLNLIWKIGMVVGAFIIGAMSRFIPFKPLTGPDNPIEEVAEDFIEDAIGIEIDLSPGTPENDEGNEQ